jgi:predicted nucleic acid-binding protein
MSWSIPADARRVFTDTSAYFAAVNRTDANHAEAAAALAELVASRRHLFTTNFILAELHALLLARLNRTVAATALRQLDESRLTTVVRVSARDERRARQIIARYDDKDFSLTDATSFAVTERLHIRHAFSLDHNYAQYGWTLIGPPEAR